MEQAMRQRHPERGQFVPQYRSEVHRTFAASEGVAKLPAGRKGRRSRGENPQFGEDVGSDLQDPRRISELMNLVEDDHRPGTTAVKDRGITHHIFDGRQVAIHIERPFLPEAPGQRGFAAAAHA